MPHGRRSVHRGRRSCRAFADSPCPGSDLQDLYASLLQVAEQPRPVSARYLDADTPDRSEGAHPGQHLLVAMPGGGERLTSEKPVMVIDDGGDVEILVDIDAADDKGASG